METYKCLKRQFYFYEDSDSLLDKSIAPLHHLYGYSISIGDEYASELKFRRWSGHDSALGICGKFILLSLIKYSQQC